jgi:poly(3-hydroxybutyrate) depolymerase
LVRPQDIRQTALMTVEGELDDISGSGQTAAAHGLCTGIAKSLKTHLEVPGAGHYGIFSGRRWRDVVYPQVKTFIQNGQASLAGKGRRPSGVASDQPAKVSARKSSRSPLKKPARKTAGRSGATRA